MKNTAHFAFWPRRVPRQLVYPKVPLFEFLETSARRYPDTPAIIYYGTRIFYGRLADEARRTAAALFGLGVKTGDRVALYLQNTPHFAAGFYGILRANAVVVPINPMLTEREVFQLLTDSGAVAAITTADLCQRLVNVREQCDLVHILVGDYKDYLPSNPELPMPESMQADIEAGNESVRPWRQALENVDAAPPEQETDCDDMVLLPYTSGSTGVPKGCVHTHSTVISNTLSSAVWHNMMAGNVMLATLPLFHVTGLVHSMLAPVYAGATIVMLTRWDRQAAVEAIEKYGCTHWTNITTMVIDILNDPGIAGRDLSSLMIIGGGGGAPLPEAMGQKLMELTGLQYVEGYGMTETISQTHFNPPDRPKLQCIGIPDFGVDARIIDLDTAEQLGAGERGELVINGPEVMEGYWKKPEENEKNFISIDDKWFLRTGDICSMDEDGYFYIVDRSKRMINAAGYKVWPTEVEGVLYQHPAVSEVCVVGVPHPVRVETVKAFVVPAADYRGRISEQDIIDWAREQMAAYRYPRVVEFVEDLPKSGTGKIQWRQLQQKEREKAGSKDG